LLSIVDGGFLIVEDNQVPKPCSPGECCCYTICNHEIICASCIGCDCSAAQLLEAETSAFHTEELVAGTQAINKILSEIPHDSGGRTPSFIQTKIGVMLVWVRHQSEDLLSENSDVTGVTSADDNETIAKALNLKNF
jgi:hypothetical protein